MIFKFSNAGGFTSKTRYADFLAGNTAYNPAIIDILVIGGGGSGGRSYGGGGGDSLNAIGGGGGGSLGPGGTGSGGSGVIPAQTNG